MFRRTTCSFKGTVVMGATLLLTAATAMTEPITGRVVNAVQQPVPGAIVYAGMPTAPIVLKNNTLHLSERYPRALTDKEGRFELEVPSSAGVTLLARDLEDRSGFQDYRPDGDNTIVIADPAAVEAVLPSGALKLGEGMQLTALSSAGLRFTYEASSRMKPPYLFRNLIPGDYRLETTHQVPQVGCCFKRVTTRQVHAELTPGRSKRVQLGGHNLPYVHGAITDEAGDGLHGVWVRLVPDGDVRRPLALSPKNAAQTPQVWSTVTEKDGAYQIDDVPPGSYTLRAFRRLAMNAGSHTLEAVNTVTIPKDITTRTPIRHDIQVDLRDFAPLRKGDKAPPINADTLAGDPFQLAEHVGQVVVLHFYAAWCSPCVETIGDYNALADVYANQPVTVVAISLDESEAEARAFADEHAINHPIVYQGSWSKNAIRKAYRVNAIPFTVLIAKDGSIRHQNLHGELLRDQVAEALSTP